MEQDWFQIGKGVLQDFILSPCLFNLYEECREPLGRAQAVSRSRDERGACKAALPLGVTLGTQFVPFLFLSYCYCAFY